MIHLVRSLSNSNENNPNEGAETIELVSLFHSTMVRGKNEYLKQLLRVGKGVMVKLCLCLVE